MVADWARALRAEGIEVLIHAGRPELGIAGPHLDPFGGFDKLFDWLGPKLKG